MKRTVLAFLVAPFPAALIESIVVGVWPKVGKGIFEHPASMFVGMCLFFYLLEIVIAVPLYLATRKRPPRNLSTYGVTGSVTVLLPIIVGLGIAISRGGLSTYQVVYNLAFFGLGGFLAGAVFWRVAISRTDSATA